MRLQQAAPRHELRIGRVIGQRMVDHGAIVIDVAAESGAEPLHLALDDVGAMRRKLDQRIEALEPILVKCGVPAR